jgi:hypothetical protein
LEFLDILNFFFQYSRIYFNSRIRRTDLVSNLTAKNPHFANQDYITFQHDWRPTTMEYGSLRSGKSFRMIEEEIERRRDREKARPWAEEKDEGQRDKRTTQALRHPIPYIPFRLSV